MERFLCTPTESTEEGTVIPDDVGLRYTLQCTVYVEEGFTSIQKRKQRSSLLFSGENFLFIFFYFIFYIYTSIYIFFIRFSIQCITILRTGSGIVGQAWAQTLATLCCMLFELISSLEILVFLGW